MKRSDIIFYSIIAVVAIVLYATGKHTEVIGFAQRGILATGIFDPDVEDAIGGDNVYPSADYNWRLADADGNDLDLSEFKGKVIFLNLWATWCPPCIAELPGIASLYEDVETKDIVFILLSQDEDFETSKDFMQRKGYDLPIYKALGSTPPAYRSEQIPTTYIIDPRGNIRLKHSGMADYDSEEFVDFLQGLETGD